MFSKKVSVLFSILVLLAVAAVMFGQETAARTAAPAAEAIVTPQSPAVKLAAVGREVAPGVFEVSPDALHGRRLLLPPSTGGTARSICIGKWNASTKTCRGILIEW